MNGMKQASSHDKDLTALCHRQCLNKPTRVTGSTTVDISRALGAIPEELGAVLALKILEKRIDGDQLLELLNSVEAKAEEESIATDVFCRHYYLFLQYLDRVSWNRLCSTNSQIYHSSRSATPPWPQQLLRVDSPVISVAFSLDGKWLACGSVDGMVRLWNGRNGSCTLLEGHTEYVRCISFSPNGKILATGSGDGSICLWDLGDKSYRRLNAHNGAIMSISFSPSGSSLASGSLADGDVRLWDTNDGKCTRIVATRTKNVWFVALSPDGKTLATRPEGGDSIFLWDIESDDDRGSPSGIIVSDGQNVFSLMYSPDGIFLASVEGSAIRIWRASDGSLEKVVRGNSMFCAAFSPNGKLVASTDCDGRVRLWNIDDQDADSLAVSPHAHRHEADVEDDNDLTACIHTVAFTHNGQNVASGGDEGNIFLWDTRKFL